MPPETQQPHCVIHAPITKATDADAHPFCSVIYDTFTEGVGRLLVFFLNFNFKMAPTNDTAKEAQAGGVTLPGVPRTLPPGRRQRDAQADWAVEFASAWFDGNHRAEGRLVTELPSQQFIRDGLRLRRERRGKNKAY